MRYGPEPLWKVVGYWFTIVGMAFFGGVVGRLTAPQIGTTELTKARMELQIEKSRMDSLITEAVDFHERVQPWLWVEGCNPKPVAVLKNWDERRLLVTLACHPAVEIPEPVEVQR